MSSSNVFALLGILVLLRSSTGATDMLSEFVDFIISYRRLCGFLDSPFSLLASFCILAATGNSTITLRNYIRTK